MLTLHQAAHLNISIADADLQVFFWCKPLIWYNPPGLNSTKKRAGAFCKSFSKTTISLIGPQKSLRERPWKIKQPLASGIIWNNFDEAGTSLGKVIV